jgi:peroxiredoxin
MTYLLISLLLSACNNGSSGQQGDTANNSQNEIAANGSDLADRQLENPDIEINVSGFTGGQATIIGIFTDQQYRLDTASFDKNGVVVFTRDSPYQPGLAFILLPDQSYFQVLIDADQTFRMSTAKGNLVNGMTVEGSLDNELLFRNLQFESAFQPRINAANAKLKSLLPASPEYADVEAERDALLQERKDHLNEIFTAHPDAFFTAFKSAGQNPELVDVRRPNGDIDSTRQLYIYRSQFWDNVDFSDERLLYTPVISNKLKRYIEELTPQHADSINAAASMLADKALPYPEYFKYFVNWITLKYEPGKTTLMDGEAVYVHMVKNYFTNERAFWSDSFEVYSLYRRATEMESSLIGLDAPEVTARDINGQMRSISEITSPYIVVYIFSPSCDHCIEESPRMVQFHREWKNKGLEVFAIAAETDDTEWRNFVTSNDMMDFINVFDPTNAAIYGRYFIDNTPEVYLINPERKIIAKNLKVEQIAAMIERDRGK